MKKILLFFLFLFIFNTSFSMLFYEKENTKFAFLEGEFSTYIIDFEKNIITTKQLSNLLNKENFKIISITPYYSPIYEKKIHIQSYSFSTYSSVFLLKKIENEYLQQLSNLGLQKEFVKYKIEGIPIRYLEVYTNLLMIKSLKKEYPLLNYYIYEH